MGVSPPTFRLVQCLADIIVPRRAVLYYTGFDMDTQAWSIKAQDPLQSTECSD